MQHLSCLSLTLERRSRIGNDKYSIDGRPVISEFTLTPTRTTEITVEKETVEIADKQAPVCRHLKQKTTDHAWKFFRLKFSSPDYFFLVMLEF